MTTGVDRSISLLWPLLGQTWKHRADRDAFIVHGRRPKTKHRSECLTRAIACCQLPYCLGHKKKRKQGGLGGMGARDLIPFVLASRINGSEAGQTACDSHAGTENVVVPLTASQTSPTPEDVKHLEPGIKWVSKLQGGVYDN